MQSLARNLCIVSPFEKSVRGVHTLPNSGCTQARQMPQRCAVRNGRKTPRMMNLLLMTHLWHDTCTTPNTAPLAVRTTRGHASTEPRERSP